MLQVLCQAMVNKYVLKFAIHPDHSYYEANPNGPILLQLPIQSSLGEETRHAVVYCLEDGFPLHRWCDAG